MKTLSSVCLLIAQQHKDRKHFQLTDNTHGVLNVKVRVNISTDQYFICDHSSSQIEKRILSDLIAFQKIGYNVAIDVSLRYIEYR